MKRIAFAIISIALLVALAGAEGNFKTITGVNLGGLAGAAQSDENNDGGNFKRIVGTNLQGLGGAAENEGSSEGGNFKRIVDINLEGLKPTNDTDESNFKPILGFDLVGLGGESQSESSTPETSEVVNVSESTMIVYVGGSTIPLGTYQTTFGKYFWIEDGMGWSQYASIPQYSGLSLIAYTPMGGQGEIFEMFPGSSGSALQGVYKGIYYNFIPGYNRIMYRGDVVGRHHLLFTINDEPSNGIIIDVIGGPVLGSSPVLGMSP